MIDYAIFTHHVIHILYLLVLAPITIMVDTRWKYEHRNFSVPKRSNYMFCIVRPFVVYNTYTYVFFFCRPA